MTEQGRVIEQGLVPIPRSSMYLAAEAGRSARVTQKLN